MVKEIKYPIRFRFNLEKFIASVTFFAKETKDLDKLKIAKLLYFADKYHLLRYGTPIIGDTYYHLDYGPVPSKALDIINEILEEKIFSFTPVDCSNKKYFEEYLNIKKKGLVNKYSIFEVKKEPNLDCLSDSEQEALRQTVKKYGCLSSSDLIRETHKDASWNKTQKNDDIDYRLFFVDEPEARPEALDYLETLQEDSEFITGLISD